MNYDIEVIHVRLLEMLKRFNEICNENNLTYYLVEGTCLGAVRHKGYIPWDDDLDLAMPRPDYERLATLFENLNDDMLEAMYYKNTKNSPIHYIKIIDKTTTLIEDRYRYYVEGLYIDVFPIDGCNPNDMRRNKKVWTIHSMIMKHCSTKSEETFKSNIKACIAKIIPLSLLHNILEREIKRYSYEESNYVVNYFSAYAEKEIVPKEFYGTPVLYEFENNFFYGPERAELYLERLYGDYLKLPPKEDRVFRHNYYYLDLNKPHKKFVNER